MAAKLGKSKHKSTQNHHKTPDRSGRKTLRSDAKAIGTAIAAAVVGELAQITLNRAGRALNGSNRVEPEHISINQSANSANPVIDKLEETQHSVKDKGKGAVKGTARVIQQVIKGIQPALIELANTVVDPGLIDHTAEEGAGTAKQAAKAAHQTGNSLASLGDSLASPEDTVRAVVETAEQFLNNADETATHVLGTLIQEVKSPGKKNKKHKQKTSKKKAKKKKSGDNK